MEKVPEKQEGWLTNVRERRIYWSYFMGRNMIYAFVTLFLATYLLLFGLDAASTAGVLLAAMVWDAVNDIIFGALIDKVKFKKGGRFIPWLRISLPFIFALDPYKLKPADVEVMAKCNNGEISKNECDRKLSMQY
jgi:Na+/melibiose symporter-like transporter